MKKVLVLILILVFSMTLLAAAGFAKRLPRAVFLIKPAYKRVVALAFPGCLKCGCLYEVKYSAGRDVASVDLSWEREDTGCDCNCHKDTTKTYSGNGVARIPLD